MNRYVGRFGRISLLVVSVAFITACSKDDGGDDGDKMTLSQKAYAETHSETLGDCLRAEFALLGIDEFDGLSATELEQVDFEVGTLGSEIRQACLSADEL